MKRLLIINFFLWLALYNSAAQQKNLEYFIRQGIQNSPLLKDYQFQVQSNKIDSQRLKAGYGPQVNANSTGFYAPVIKGWGYDGAISNLHTYNALIGLSKMLTGKDNINNQYLSLQLQNLGLQNLGKISEQDLKRSITQQYITAYGDLLQISFNGEMLSLLKDEETILKKLTEKAVYKQTDYLSFLVNIQQQELLIKQLRNQYQNDFATLNYMAGTEDTTYILLEAPFLSAFDLPALKETVFYQQFQIDSVKIKVSDKQVDLSYKPKVSLFADGGYSSSFAVTPYKNFGVSAGISLTVPVYDGRQRKMLHQKNDMAEQTRKNYQDFFSTRYSQQVAQLKQQLVLIEQLTDQTATQIAYADGLIKAQRQQLVTGDVRIADYIIAIGNYLNAKNIITQNTINKLQIINQLNYWSRKL